jgi:ABC-type Fe2+-enterobactin transport system substrate-binding protein
MAATDMADARKVSAKLAAARWDVSAVRLSQRPDLIAAFMKGEMGADAVAKEIGAKAIGD